MARKKPKGKKQAKPSQKSQAYRNNSLKEQLAGFAPVAEARPASEKSAAPLRDEHAAAPAPSEEDLFRAAVADIDASAAILAKYDVVTGAPAPKASSNARADAQTEAAVDDEDFDPTDSRLFLDAVDGVDAASHKKAKS